MFQLLKSDLLQSWTNLAQLEDGLHIDQRIDGFVLDQLQQKVDIVGFLVLYEVAEQELCSMVLDEFGGQLRRDVLDQVLDKRWVGWKQL